MWNAIIISSVYVACIICLTGSTNAHLIFCLPEKIVYLFLLF
nr:MAG TPA: hypothetical protein [Caudoviricetes sp.]